MSTRGYANAKPADDMTMVDVERRAERLGLVIITDGKAFDYARPGEQRPGWRVFRMVDKNAARPLDPKEPQ